MNLNKMTKVLGMQPEILLSYKRSQMHVTNKKSMFLCEIGVMANTLSDARRETKPSVISNKTIKQPLTATQTNTS